MNALQVKYCRIEVMALCRLYIRFEIMCRGAWAVKVSIGQFRTWVKATPQPGDPRHGHDVAGAFQLRSPLWRKAPSACSSESSSNVMNVFIKSVYTRHMLPESTSTAILQCCSMGITVVTHDR